MPLTDAQVDRYSRQIILPEVGGIGQEKLLAARVQIGATGVLAAWAARYLVAAGVGEVTLAPPLAEALRASLADLNPDCRLVASGGSFADERPPHVLLADAGDAAIAGAWRRGIAAIVTRVGAAAGELTMLSSSHPSSACPECAAPLGDIAPDDGAAASAAPLLAVLAATEVLKLVLGVGKGLCGRRLVYDVRTQSIDEFRLACRTGCTWTVR